MPAPGYDVLNFHLGHPIVLYMLQGSSHHPQNYYYIFSDKLHGYIFCPIYGFNCNFNFMYFNVLRMAT